MIFARRGKDVTDKFAQNVKENVAKSKKHTKEQKINNEHG